MAIIKILFFFNRASSSVIMINVLKKSYHAPINVYQPFRCAKLSKFFSSKQEQRNMLVWWDLLEKKCIQRICGKTTVVYVFFKLKKKILNFKFFVLYNFPKSLVKIWTCFQVIRDQSSWVVLYYLKGTIPAENIFLYYTFFCNYAWNNYCTE